MAEKTKKHIESADEGKLKLINFVSFLLGFSQALLTYVASDYFRQAIGAENVSVFYFIAYSISLIMMLNLHKLINRFGKATVFFFFFFLQICFIALLIFAQPSAAGIALLILYLIAANLTFVALDIILESYSEDRVSGRIRGLHLTVYNTGFILGPFLSTKLLSKFGFDGLFVVAMVIYMCIFIVGLLGLRSGNSKFHQKLTVSDLVKKIFVNRAIMRIYSIAFILDFFYAIMIVYTTLYLLDRGLTWDQLGIIFTIMLIPFVILQYPIGVLADKKYGEKEMMIAGILIMGISAGSIFFIETNSVMVWGAVLFATRVGAAMVEILRDSYFYKTIDGRDMDVISFFRTATSVGYILATALSAFLLVVLPVKFVFLLIAAIVLMGLYPAFKLVDNKCEAELTRRRRA